MKKNNLVILFIAILFTTKYNTVSAQLGLTGEIKLFAGSFEPDGWAFCNGQLLDIKEYEALYKQIGTTYGGDGKINFALPDLRGRIVIGSGEGTGLTKRSQGEYTGTSQIQLYEQNLPHSHYIPAKIIDSADMNNGKYPTLLLLPTNKTENINIGPAGLSVPATNIQPSLGINYIICLSGYQDGPDADSAYYLGDIRIIAGSYLPGNWAKCDGSTLKVETNQALYSLIGTLYGGDGKTGFKLPDIRGKAVAGPGADTSNAINFSQTVGDISGTDSMKMTIANLPPHIHKVEVANEKNSSNLQTGKKMLLSTNANENFWWDEKARLGTNPQAGEATPVNNMQPSLVLNYYICMYGKYPPRD
jgi:microcystin-dependent protein